MAGWKKWAFGDLVSADLFQGNVQDQVVQKYADSAARSAALGTAVADGMVSYLTGTDSLEVYNGSSWISYVPSTGGSFTGDINATNYAGRGNAVINGAFDIWQRGTSFTNPASGAYLADRWTCYIAGTGVTRTISQQTFTPGTAPVAGYESTYFIRWNRSVAGTSPTDVLTQRIEDVRTFAGQTVTLSFWAKADATRTLSTFAYQQFGSGGSTSVSIGIGAHTLTTTWQRFTATVTLPAISGKTIGTNSFLQIDLDFGVGSPTTFTVDIWGMQLEAGSVATPFKRNASSLQGELAACQRYYWRTAGGGAYSAASLVGYGASSTLGTAWIALPVPMRVAPTSVDFSGLQVYGLSFGGQPAVTAVGISGWATNMIAQLDFTVASGITTGGSLAVRNNNNTAGYLGLSAEL